MSLQQHAGGLGEYLPEPLGLGFFPGLGAVEQLRVLGCVREHPFLQSTAVGAHSPSQVPSVPPGWMLVARVSAQPPHTESSRLSFWGRHTIFFHCSAEAELIQYSPSQHRSFLKSLFLVFLKLCILRHETQHPLAPEAFPQRRGFGSPQHPTAW